MTDRCHKEFIFPIDGLSLLLLIMGMGLILSGGCRKADSSVKTPSLTPREAVLVRTMTIPKGGGTEKRAFPVFAKEGQTAKLSFRVPGQILEFDPILGRRVAKDEVIARLDQRDYKLAVARLEEGINEANAALTAMKTGARAEDVAALEAQLRGAETAAINAKTQLTRMENLRRDGTASQVQYDMAKTTSDGATAQRDALKKQLEKAKKGAREEEIQAMEAKIAGLHVDLTLAQNKLADTELKAPFDGVIAQKFFDNYETVAPGIAVLELIDANGIEATLNVSEEMVMRKGDIQKVECCFAALPDAVYEGEIKEIGQTTRKGNLSYPLTVRIEATDPKDHKDDVTGILPGMSGTATIFLANKDKTVLLPSAALIPSEKKDVAESAVWIVNSEEKLERHPVRIKTFTPEGAIVEDGLVGGETIVAAGARFLRDGEWVRSE